MQKNILTFVVLLFSFDCQNSYLPSWSNYSIGEVFGLAKQHHNAQMSDPSFVKKDTIIFENYSDFSFQEFSPINKLKNVKDSSYFYKIGFDRHNRVKILLHYELTDKNKKYGNFKMDFFHSANCIIYSVQILDKQYPDIENTSGYSALFFVYDKSIKKNYFIATTNPRYHFDKCYPIFDINTITRIGVLDDNFYLTHLFRFRKGELVSASEFIFEKDSKRIKYENIILLKKLKERKVILGDTLTFRNLEMIYKTYQEKYSHIANILEAEDFENFKNRPLWILEGDHRINIEGFISDPNSILPIWEQE